MNFTKKEETGKKKKYLGNLDYFRGNERIYFKLMLKLCGLCTCTYNLH